jgi:hypothetical protein
LSLTFKRQILHGMIFISTHLLALLVDHGFQILVLYKEDHGCHGR